MIEGAGGEWVSSTSDACSVFLLFVLLDGDHFGGRMASFTTLEFINTSVLDWNPTWDHVRYLSRNLLHVVWNTTFIAFGRRYLARVRRVRGISVA